METMGFTFTYKIDYRYNTEDSDTLLCNALKKEKYTLLQFQIILKLINRE